jgi:DNA polymerase III delta prime subunit
MFPNRLPGENQTEREVFQKFQDELSDDWSVYYSVTFLYDEKYPVGECDFILVGKPGIFIIEVKGCLVERLGPECNHRWAYYYEGEKSKPKQKNESPVDQALRNRQSVSNWMNQQLPKLSPIIGCGIVNPNYRYEYPHAATDWGPELSLSGRSDFLRRGSIRKFIDSVVPFWEQKPQPRPTHELTEHQIKQIHRRIFPTVKLENLGERLGGVINDQDIILTQQQSHLFRHLSNQGHSFLVEGFAGTGKTVIARNLAKELASQGKKVLLLCRSELLAKELAHNLNEFENLKCCSLLHLLDELLPGLSLAEPNSEFSLQEIVTKALQTFNEQALSEFDALIIDEGQDFFHKAYIKFLDSILKNGLSEGQWYIFYDPQQALYHDSDSGIQSLQDFRYRICHLDENCRNTDAIIKRVNNLARVELQQYRRVHGGEITTHWFHDTADLIHILEDRLSSYFSDYADHADMVFLYTGESMDFILNDYKLAVFQENTGKKVKFFLENPSVQGRVRVYKLRDMCDLATHERNKHFDTCSIKDFKGLERKFVFVFGLNDLETEYFRRRAYVGLTRSRAYLDIFLPKSYELKYAELIAP